MPSESRTDSRDRSEFLRLAGLVEGGTVLVALALGWLLGIRPFALLTWSWSALAWGILAVLPMLGVFLIAHSTRSLVVDMLGGPLSRCRSYDIVALAGLAGLGEELLFRGVLEPAIGFLTTNLLFGLVHAVTPLYAALATMFGMYLSWLTFHIDNSPNLLRAIVAHGLYDYIAFLLVIREYRLLHHSTTYDTADVVPSGDDDGRSA